jgi:hypothetical protein
MKRNGYTTGLGTPDWHEHQQMEARATERGKKRTIWGNEKVREA